VITPAVEQVVPFQPAQPHRQGPAAGVVSEDHEERGDPEPGAEASAVWLAAMRHHACDLPQRVLSTMLAILRPRRMAGRRTSMRRG
jgi:hypothetical protein